MTVGLKLLPYNSGKASCGLEGWHPIREAHWWRGPPQERAARMTAHALRKFWPNVDHRHIVNMLDEARPPLIIEIVPD